MEEHVKTSDNLDEKKKTQEFCIFYKVKSLVEPKYSLAQSQD
jgi:hypothetical protein